MIPQCPRLKENTVDDIQIFCSKYLYKTGLKNRTEQEQEQETKLADLVIFVVFH